MVPHRSNSPADGNSMPSVAAKRRCQSCHLMLPVERFQGRNAYRKITDNCRSCRFGRGLQISNGRRLPLGKNKSSSALTCLAGRSGSQHASTSTLAKPAPAESRKRQIAHPPTYINMPSFKRLPTASAGIDASNAAAEKDTSTTGGSIERVGASSSSVERPHATTSKATRTSNAAPPRTVSSTAKRRSSLSMVSGRALPLIRPRRAFTAAISRRGSYCHRAPAGYAFSGPTDDSLSLQRQRRFVVPPGVTRVSYKDFPTLDLPLERGMHSHPTGCVECRNRNLHCTFGAGIRPNGKTRDPQNGRCDWCVFGSKKCVGNGYKGNTVEQKGAHETLAELLGRVEAQIDGCLRAGERDESMMGEASRIMGRIASVNLKLGRLEGLLREVKRSAMREGKVRVGSRGS